MKDRILKTLSTSFFVSLILASNSSLIKASQKPKAVVEWEKEREQSQKMWRELIDTRKEDSKERAINPQDREYWGQFPGDKQFDDKVKKSKK